MSDLENYSIILDQRVAWGDMDAYGHVNNTIYYRYMESARILYFDALNIFDEDIFTVVSSNQCRYLKPLFYPDILKIGVRVEELRNSAMRMSYILWSNTQKDIVALGESVIVCVDKITMKKKSMPDNIRLKIREIELKSNHNI